MGINRGFVAAPLLGTLVFLAAIVFVAHVNQVDRTETATIVSETYHNRIVNILEDYRADLGVIFAVNVVRAIQRHLTSQCWTLFSLSNERPDPSLAFGDTNTGTQKIPPVPFNKFLKKLNYDNLPFCKNALTGAANNPQPAGDPPNGCTTRAVTESDPAVPNSFLCSENCNQQLDYYELRYQKCSQVSEIIKDGICPYEKEYGITAWIDSTRGTPIDKDNPNSARLPYSFEGINLSLANDALVKNSFIDRIECEMRLGGDTYRLPLISPKGQLVIRNPSRQEECSGTPAYGFDTGVECACTKENGCRKLVGRDADGKPVFDDVEASPAVPIPSCKGVPGEVVTGQNIQNCRTLIGDSLFDCRNFAVPERQDGNPFRCCDRFYYNAADPTDADNGRCCTGELAGTSGCGGAENPPDNSDHIVQGCGQGSFFVKVNILADNELYRRVPRVVAQDKVGNTIQGGALGQSNFVVHVKYPIYKYLDAAFQLYAPLAYGVSGQKKTLANGRVIDVDLNNPAANSKKHKGKGRVAENFIPPGDILEAVSTATEGGVSLAQSVPEESLARASLKDSKHVEGFEQSNGEGLDDQNTREGVIEGVCYGRKCQCDSSESSPAAGACLFSNFHLGRRTNFEVKNLPSSPKQDNLAQWQQESNINYYDTFLDPDTVAHPTSICRLVAKKAQGGICEDWGTCKMQVWARGYNFGDGKEFLLLCRGEDSPRLFLDAANKCRAIAGSASCQQDPRIKEKFYALNNPANVMAVSQCTPDAAHSTGYCAFIDKLYLTLDFRDFDEKTLVLPEPPAQTAAESPLPHNRFCWYATPSHYNPEDLEKHAARKS